MWLCEERAVQTGRGKGDPHGAESKTVSLAVLAEEVGARQRTAVNGS